MKSDNIQAARRPKEEGERHLRLVIIQHPGSCDRRQVVDCEHITTRPAHTHVCDADDITFCCTSVWTPPGPSEGLNVIKH